jgi:hypothetical protein
VDAPETVILHYLPPYRFLRYYQDVARAGDLDSEHLQIHMMDYLHDKARIENVMM